MLDEIVSEGETKVEGVESEVSGLVTKSEAEVLTIKDKLLMIPKWRLYIYIGVVLFGIVYLCWVRWGAHTEMKGGSVIVNAPVAKAVANMPTTRILIPKGVVVFKDTEKVVEKLGLPTAKPEEKVFSAVDVPRVKYGATVTTFVNTTTGTSRTAIKAKEAPWFSFERGNELGIEGGINTRSRYVDVDYQRDIASVKGAIISLKGFGTFSPDEESAKRVNVGVGVRVKYQW